MAETNKYLMKAEQAYADLKAGKSIGLKNEEDIREALLQGKLRWGMTSTGSFKPLIPTDPEYDKGYASPREALHFVKGEEPSRTESGKFFGSIVAPVSQHRIEGDPVRSEQRSAAMDYGQDIGRGVLKFALPVAATIGMRSPMGAALVGGASSGIGSIGNVGVSAARHDPYGDSPAQGLATAIATGLGIGLGRRFTPTRQAGRWSENEAAKRLQTIGINPEEAKSAAAEARYRLTHGLPEYTYGNFKREPLKTFDEILYPGAAEMPVYMDSMALPMEGTYKDGKFKPTKIMPRKPRKVSSTITTEGVTDVEPSKGKLSKTKSKTTTIKDGTTTTTTSDAATVGGRTAKSSTKTTVKELYPEVTDAEARNWLERNGISPSKPGAIEQAKRLIREGYQRPDSEYGRILFGRGGETGLNKKQLTRYMVDPSVPEVAQDILREKTRFKDPEMDKAWRESRRKFGERADIFNEHSGTSDTRPIVSAKEFETKKGSWRTKGKAGLAGLGGFLLPIGTELLFNPIMNRNKTDE